jgi:hypothetical protein
MMFLVFQQVSVMYTFQWMPFLLLLIGTGAGGGTVGVCAYQTTKVISKLRPFHSNHHHPHHHCGHSSGGWFQKDVATSTVTPFQRRFKNKHDGASSRFSSHTLFMLDNQNQQQPFEQQQVNDDLQQNSNNNSKLPTTKDSKGRNKEWNTTIFPAKEFKQGQQNLPAFLGGFPSSTTASSKTSDVVMDENLQSSSSFPSVIQKEIYTQVIAGMIGGLTGISVAGFKLSIEGIREFCYGGSLNFISPQDEIVPYFVVPVFGAIGVALLSLMGSFSPGLKGVVKEVDGDSLRYS